MLCNASVHCCIQSFIVSFGCSSTHIPPRSPSEPYTRTVLPLFCLLLATRVVIFLLTGVFTATPSLSNWSRVSLAASSRCTGQEDARATCTSGGPRQALQAAGDRRRTSVGYPGQRCKLWTRGGHQSALRSSTSTQPGWRSSTLHLSPHPRP